MFHMHPPQINPCCFVRWPRRFTRRGHSRHGRVPQPGHGRVPQPGHGRVPQPGHGRVPQPGHGRVPPRARAGTAAGMSARQLRTEGPVFSGKRLGSLPGIDLC